MRYFITNGNQRPSGNVLVVVKGDIPDTLRLASGERLRRGATARHGHGYVIARRGVDGRVEFYTPELPRVGVMAGEARQWAGRPWEVTGNKRQAQRLAREVGGHVYA